MVGPMKRVVGVNYSFPDRDGLKNRAFDPSRRDHISVCLREMRSHFESRGIEMHSLDLVDFEDPEVQYIIYCDYSWRSLGKDSYLDQIPFEKRVLVMVEPSNVNPTLYYVPWLRNRFKTVFTWNDALAKRPNHVLCNGFPWADPDDYIENPYASTRFEDRKFLVAMSSNRWAYMPTSTFNYRIRVYRYFESRCGDDFDLYGRGWNEPRSFCEKWLGYHHFGCYRGALPFNIDAKMDVISKYKFTICIENNITEPGYVNDKFIDCLCARCVPVYHGWKHADRYVPPDCYVNIRDFKNLDDILSYIRGMSEGGHQAYIDAIDRFLKSEAAQYFTFRNKYDTMVDHLYPELAAVRR